MKSEKIKGLIYGSFIGDALALGPHWIYDTEKIDDKFTPITTYTAPIHTPYHPNNKIDESLKKLGL